MIESVGESVSASASREVAHLEQHGLVATRPLGRIRLVRPNWSFPWVPELGSVLMPSVGVVGRLSDASEPFIAHIKEQPLAQIPREVAHGVCLAGQGNREGRTEKSDDRARLGPWRA